MSDRRGSRYGIADMKKQQNQEFSTRLEAKGDQVLFGASINDMKRKLGAPDGRPLADFLSTLAIKAKDFATEMTSHNVLEKDLRGTRSIGDEHVASNKAVRNSMLARGIKPEELPPGCPCHETVVTHTSPWSNVGYKASAFEAVSPHETAR